MSSGLPKYLSGLQFWLSTAKVMGHIQLGCAHRTWSDPDEEIKLFCYGFYFLLPLLTPADITTEYFWVKSAHASCQTFLHMEKYLTFY